MKKLPATNKEAPRDSLRQAMVLFADALADERAKETGVPRSPETDREVAETIAAHCFAKDITDRAREVRPLALEPGEELDVEGFPR